MTLQGPRWLPGASDLSIWCGCCLFLCGLVGCGGKTESETDPPPAFSARPESQHQTSTPETTPLVAEDSRSDPGEFLAVKDATRGQRMRPRALDRAKRSRLTKQCADLEQLASDLYHKEDFVSLRPTISQLSDVRRQLFGEGEWVRADERDWTARVELLASMTPNDRQTLRKVNDLEKKAFEANHGGRFGDAAAETREAIRLLDEIGVLSAKYRASLLKFVATQYFLMGDNPRAIKTFLEALDVVGTDLGDQPDRAGLNADLGLVYEFQGDYRRALTTFSGALKEFRNTVGEQDMHYVDCLTRYGDLRSRVGDAASAEQILKRAVAIARDLDVSQERTYIGCIQDLAACYERSGRYAEAEPLDAEALRFYESNDSVGSVDLLVAEDRMGRIYAKLRRFNEAEPYLERSLAETSRRFGDDSLYASFAMRDIGELRVLKENCQAAEPLLKKALETQRRVMGAENPEIKPLLEVYAKCERGLGHDDEAVNVEQQVHAIDQSLTTIRAELARQ